jgi:hypothetical protein
MYQHLASTRFRAGFGAAALAAVLCFGSAGCEHSDKPHGYGQERPSVDDLDARDSGLQSRDVNEAANEMAADLLALPELNQSKTQWTIVVGKMEDQTRDPYARADYDLFLQAVKVQIGRLGKGRVQLITNRDRFYNFREREREGGGRDEFGQGGGGQAGAPGAVNPDFILTGVVRSLPNRGTVYYQFEFSLEDLQRRTTPWLHMYQVKVAR